VATAGGQRPVAAGVLALQGDVAEHLRALREAGADEVREVRRPADLDGLRTLVIPGGESTTIGKLMVEYGLDEAIRRRVGEGMAVFGTCAGLILLSTEIEGSDQPRLGLLPARVRRNAYGRQVDSFETVLEVPALSPEPMPAVFIRAPRVESVGPGVEVLARHAGSPVLCRAGRILAATFHPELTADRRLHRHALELGSGARP
jgi:5'-phosphate synthase pdxT subunit